MNIWKAEIAQVYSAFLLHKKQSGSLSAQHIFRKSFHEVLIPVYHNEHNYHLIQFFLFQVSDELAHHLDIHMFVIWCTDQMPPTRIFLYPSEKSDCLLISLCCFFVISCFYGLDQSVYNSVSLFISYRTYKILIRNDFIPLSHYFFCKINTGIILFQK